MDALLLYHLRRHLLSLTLRHLGATREVGRDASIVERAVFHVGSQRSRAASEQLAGRNGSTGQTSVG